MRRAFGGQLDGTYLNELLSCKLLVCKNHANTDDACFSYARIMPARNMLHVGMLLAYANVIPLHVGMLLASANNLPQSLARFLQGRAKLTPCWHKTCIGESIVTMFGIKLASKSQFQCWHASCRGCQRGVIEAGEAIFRFLSSLENITIHFLCNFYSFKQFQHVTNQHFQL